ncbi:hypothetical protein ADK67_14675 [Saccharothrix sp. NRRL B-16348]|nr:hypothetical protein ADK67_14675 [Saccharothrix sp. NRRL B-16348]
MHAAPSSPTQVLPRQLPAAPGLFTGRVADLAELDRALTTAAPDRADITGPGPTCADLSAASATVMVSAIGGAGGIGKTWLALAWAHRNLDLFPDGQLFVDLHGFSPAGDPVAPAVAVRGFLDALGVDPGRIPTSLDAQAALYRSLLAGRRMLIVLDNAATADQVVPLLPGSPTCTVLVTGRHRLVSLIDRHGARHLSLGVLTRAEARALLARRLGADRVAAEPDAVDELVELCDGYPLALSIIARNASTRPSIPLAELAVELRELGMEMLDHDTDPAASVPAVLSWSLRQLTEEQRTVFALLGVAPGPDTTLPAVAALTGLALPHARKALSVLDEASLVEWRPHGRYAMHDLVRDYATTIAQDLSDDVRVTALARVMDFHLHTAHATERLLNPHRPLPPLSRPVPGVHPHQLPDAAAATAWLEAEHATLLATQRAASTLGRHHVVWHLARALDTFHRRQGRRQDGLAAWRAALDAADHLPDPIIRVRAHRFLGNACSQAGLHQEATWHLEQALDLVVRHHDPTEQARIHRVLALVWGRQGDDRQALVHARHALDLCRSLDQPVREADALNSVGWHSARLGDIDIARDHCREALALYRRHRDPNGEADALDSLGFIAYLTGDHRQAVDHYHQAIILRRAHGHAYQVAGTLDSVGRSHAVLGQYDRAHEVWREALNLYREQGRDTDVRRVQRQLDELNEPNRDGPY